MSTLLDLDFDPIVPLPTPTPAITISDDGPRQASSAAAFLAKPRDDWDWGDLRDYVIREIEKRHGPQVREPMKEKAIFGSFIKRHGAAQSVAIAEFAFDLSNGMWQSAPISVNRFCKASDPFFADPIKQRLS
jgi:hypothetical protein